MTCLLAKANILQTIRSVVTTVKVIPNRTWDFDKNASIIVFEIHYGLPVYKETSIQYRQLYIKKKGFIGICQFMHIMVVFCVCDREFCRKLASSGCRHFQRLHFRKRLYEGRYLKIEELSNQRRQSKNRFQRNRSYICDPAQSFVIRRASLHIREPREPCQFNCSAGTPAIRVPQTCLLSFKWKAKVCLLLRSKSYKAETAIANLWNLQHFCNWWIKYQNLVRKFSLFYPSVPPIRRNMRPSAHKYATSLADSNEVKKFSK